MVRPCGAALFDASGDRWMRRDAAVDQAEPCGAASGSGRKGCLRQGTARSAGEIDIVDVDRRVGEQFRELLARPAEAAAIGNMKARDDKIEPFDPVRDREA